MSENHNIAAAVTHHENAPSVAPESVESVAALAGLISSSLKEADSRNVGGTSIQANKLDKRRLGQELTAIKTHGPLNHPVEIQNPPVTHNDPFREPGNQPVVVSVPTTERHAQVPKTSTIVDKKELTAIRRRLKKLEEDHKVLKKIIEFKPLYKKYHVKTDTFEGEVNNVTYLLDIVIKELAKKPSDIIIKAK